MVVVLHRTTFCPTALPPAIHPLTQIEWYSRIMMTGIHISHLLAFSLKAFNKSLFKLQVSEFSEFRSDNVYDAPELSIFSYFCAKIHLHPFKVEVLHVVISIGNEHK